MLYQGADECQECQFVVTLGGTGRLYSREGFQAKAKYIDRTSYEDRTGAGGGEVLIYSSGTLVPMAFRQLLEVQLKVISYFSRIRPAIEPDH